MIQLTFFRGPARQIVGRLTFHGTIVQTGTDSYRLARTIAQQTR
jgi:hypothetical protein